MTGDVEMKLDIDKEIKKQEDIELEASENSWARPIQTALCWLMPQHKSAYIHYDEEEETPEYKPCIWNSFPVYGGHHWKKMCQFYDQ